MTDIQKHRASALSGAAMSANVEISSAAQLHRFLKSLEHSDSACDVPAVAAGKQHRSGLRARQTDQHPAVPDYHALEAGSHHHTETEVKAFLDPVGIYHHVADAGAAKLRGSLLREVVLGVLAGAYIGFGFSLCILCAGQLSEGLRAREKGLFNFFFGAFGFPFGLTMCVLNGASLFTSNIAYMTTAFIERRASALAVLGIWALSWVTNFCGALLLGQLMIWGQVFHGREDFLTQELAFKKTHYDFGATLVKGILCNWLVCIAVWQANASQDIASKVLAIWLPISAFVAMGFEHCVANMYALPLAIRLGSDLSISRMFTSNLLPATLGNIIGGAFFVATAYGLSYGAWEVALVGWGGRAKAWVLRHLRRPSSSTTSSAGSLSLASMGQPNGRGQAANMV